MMTIKQMTNETFNNRKKAEDIFMSVYIRNKNLAERISELRSNFKEVHKFCNSAKANYIRKNEMKEVYERSKELLKLAKEFENVQKKIKHQKMKQAEQCSSCMVGIKQPITDDSAYNNLKGVFKMNTLEKIKQIDGFVIEVESQESKYFTTITKEFTIYTSSDQDLNTFLKYALKDITNKNTDFMITVSKKYKYDYREEYIPDQSYLRFIGKWENLNYMYIKSDKDTLFTNLKEVNRNNEKQWKSKLIKFIEMKMIESLAN